jgi:acetyltransferase-like isoleucine patch superfamily enzyme
VLAPTGELRPPALAGSSAVVAGNASWGAGQRARAWRRLASALSRSFQLFVLCRGSKAAYLRRAGARIGRHAALLNRVEEFGTEPWLVEIGTGVSIAKGVTFITHDGASRVFRRFIPGASVYGNRFGPIRVRDNCVIGLRAILLPGVSIGPDSVVGAGSVVTRDVPPGTIAAGVPARVVSTLEEYVERYRKTQIPGLSSERRELRRQLTLHFWGEER